MLRIKGVDTHANGRKKKGQEKGETRHQEKGDEAPEEEVVHSVRYAWPATASTDVHSRSPLGAAVTKAEAAVSS